MAEYLKGIVTERDSSKGMVRVKFQDHDDMVSYWLPVVQRKTLKNKYIDMPDINEHVACLMEDNYEEGVVIGAIYSNADAVPIDSNEKDHVTYKDGTTMEYDRATHTHRINYKDGTSIEYDAGSGKFEISFKDGGEIKYESSSGFMTIEAKTVLTLKAPIVNINPHLP